MSSFCNVYSGSGPVWPVRQFPYGSFPRDSAARSRDAARAWVFFEQVEAYDAAIRVKYSTLGGFIPSESPIVTQAPWYIFKSEGEKVLYKRGQSLHIELCPSVNWTPQRNIGIPTMPVTDIYPGTCEDVSRSIEDGILSTPIVIVERKAESIPSIKAFSTTPTSVRSIFSKRSTPTSSGKVSTTTSSRRESMDHT